MKDKKLYLPIALIEPPPGLWGGYGRHTDSIYVYLNVVQYVLIFNWSHYSTHQWARSDLLLFVLFRIFLPQSVAVDHYDLGCRVFQYLVEFSSLLQKSDKFLSFRIEEDQKCQKIPCGPAMLSRRKSSGDSLRLFWLNHW